MAEYGMTKGAVLIVPGYTEAELLQNSKSTSKSTSSGSSYSKDHLTKTTTKEKTTGKHSKSAKVSLPPAMYFNVRNVEYTPHGKDYEEFNSAEGLILLEKACDRYAEVQLEVTVHQRLSSVTGSVSLDKENRETLVHVEDFTTGLDSDGTILWSYPEHHDEKFIELRRSFFDNLVGRPLTVVSSLFPAIPVGYMTECDYSIGEGEEESAWSITIKEVDNWGF